jgi:hypothetical protein
VARPALAAPDRRRSRSSPHARPPPAPARPRAWLGIGVYWAADITVLYGALRACGVELGVGRLIVAYATGYVATRRSLPLGGAGVTEALMTYALYWVHVPLAPALAAVVIYRGFNFLVVAAPAVMSYRGLLELIRELGTNDQAR